MGDKPSESVYRRYFIDSRWLRRARVFIQCNLCILHKKLSYMNKFRTDKVNFRKRQTIELNPPVVSRSPKHE